jgi:methionine biosynthesis protein MetW
VSAEVREIRTPFHQFEVGFNIIIDLITPETRVLDLGCGSGTLLQRLREEKDVEGCGVELDQEKVIRCIERGIRVMRLDLDEGLEGFPDGSYEYVILSRTLQQLMYPDRLVQEMLRVGSKSIITFPNFGHWKITLEYALTGRMPTAPTYPHPWYNTPDIHRLTIKDFREFVRKIGAKIEREIFIADNVPRTRLFMANRRAQWGCCMISKA